MPGFLKHPVPRDGKNPNLPQERRFVMVSLMRWTLACLLAVLLCSCATQRCVELHDAIHFCRSGLVSRLAGSDTVNCKDRDGLTPLARTFARYKWVHWEQKRSLFLIAYILLKAGADPNLPSSETTPMHVAVDSHDIMLPALLLSYGADIDQCDVIGETALWTAINNNDARMVDFLLLKGANPHAPDTLGRTPLTYLNRVGRGNSACARLLREAAARPGKQLPPPRRRKSTTPPHS